MKTATEASADNSPPMRNIHRHEHTLEGAIASICRALLTAERRRGADLPDEGLVRMTFDDSIISDTTAKKKQGMKEDVASLMQSWEYFAKWYGKDENTARRGSEDPSAASPARRQKGSSPPVLINSDFSCFPSFSVAPRSRTSAYLANAATGAFDSVMTIVMMRSSQ